MVPSLFIIAFLPIQTFSPDSFQVPYDRPPELIGGYQSLSAKLVYPESARKDSIQGTVLISAFIDEKGHVVGVDIKKGVRKDLNEAAAKAVMQSRFKPAYYLGKPVKSRFTIPVRFKLSRN